MVGTANFISKAIVFTLKGLGILMIFMLGFIVSLIFGAMKGK